MAQSLVLSIDVCRGLGISPLRIDVWLSFSQTDLLSNYCYCYYYYFKVWNLKKRFVLIAGGIEILQRVSLKFKLFFGNIAFPLSSVLHRYVVNRAGGGLPNPVLL